MQLPIESQQVQKTAKVEMRPAGRGTVRFYVLQAQGNSIDSSKIPNKVVEFQKKVARALEMSGVLFLMGSPMTQRTVWVESTRGGIAFSVRFDAELVDPDSDVYDHFDALKKAFKSQGIAF